MATQSSSLRSCERQAEAYGERIPLSALATTLVRDPQLLVVNVFDPSVRSSDYIAIGNDQCMLKKRGPGPDHAPRFDQLA